MNLRGYHLIGLFVLLLLVTASQAYDVVLKNGKIVKGTLVSEDDSLIVLQDADGLRINIKKINVDAEKTQNANPPSPAAPVLEPAKPKEENPVKAQEKQAPRKPAKKLTEEDLRKLREKYDLGEGTFGEETAEDNKSDSEKSEATKDDFSADSENEWKAQSAKHRERLKAAEEHHVRLAQECEALKQITVQTHVVVDEQGNELQMTETREKVCEMADSARVQLEQERSDMDEFMNEAKEKAIPPGWLRDPEVTDPNE